MSDKKFEEKIYKLSPKEIILNVTLPYNLINEVENKDLGYYIDGIAPEWVWIRENINKCSDEYLWKLIAISNTYWLEQTESIREKYEKAFPNFKWWEEE